MPVRLLVVLAFAALTASASVVQADPTRLRERAAELMGEGTQTELPGVTPVAAGTGKPLSLHIPAAASSLAAFAFYALIGSLVLAGLLLVAREFSRRGLVAEVAAEAPGETAEDRAALLAGPQADAAELAGAGRFGEAIHTLLLRTLAELVRRADRPLPSSLTSREILAEVGLPGEPRAALAHLISAVEVSFFGGAEPSEADYLACVQRFQLFATAFRGRG